MYIYIYIYIFFFYIYIYIYIYIYSIKAILKYLKKIKLQKNYNIQDIVRLSSYCL